MNTASQSKNQELIFNAISRLKLLISFQKDFVFLNTASQSKNQELIFNAISRLKLLIASQLVDYGEDKN